MNITDFKAHVQTLIEVEAPVDTDESAVIKLCIWDDKRGCNEYVDLTLDDIEINDDGVLMIHACTHQNGNMVVV